MCSHSVIRGVERFAAEVLKTYLSFICMEGGRDVLGFHVSPQKPRRGSLIDDLRAERDREDYLLSFTLIFAQNILKNGQT